MNLNEDSVFLNDWETFRALQQFSKYAPDGRFSGSVRSKNPIKMLPTARQRGPSGAVIRMLLHLQSAVRLGPKALAVLYSETGRTENPR